MKKEKDAKDKPKRQNLRNTIKTTKYMLGFVWKDGKMFLFMKSVMALLNALFPLPFSIIPGLIVNELTKDVRNINTIILYVGILTITPVINQTVNMLANRYLSKLQMAINLKFEANFYNHAASMDYETLEKPDIQIMKDRAQQTLLHNALGVVDQLSGLLSSAFSVIAISTIIMTLNPLILILIICIIFINSLITKWSQQKQYLIGKELSKYSRYQWGLSYMLHQVYYAKELRLFNLKSMLINIIVDKKTEANKLQLKSNTYWHKTTTFHSLTNLIQQLTLYAYLIYCVIRKGLAVGSMTIYMGLAGQFAGSLNLIMGAYLGLTNSSLNIQEMMDFMSIPFTQLETGNKTPSFDKNSVIEFKNVSFKYPGSEYYALKNMNITVRGDEKLCIVGANGSGKSTFIKLLTRLYWPEEGEILLNGVNINEFDYLKYQSLFAPVFQDFSLYYMSLGENIVLANEYNEERLNEVCARSGLSGLIKKLPKGYNTQVYKWDAEDGFYPSGGEGQRIAMARAVYHDAPVFLLDEPTAALDPIAEYEIYSQFNEMITDKTAILITHRLSAVQLADKVAVFDSGSLIEYGTHKELYDSGGVYTEMFDKQAQFYLDGNNANSVKDGV